MDQATCEVRPATERSEKELEDLILRDRMEQIDRKLLVLSGKGGGEELAKMVGVRFLGRIPIDPDIVICGDSGRPFAADPATSPTARAFALAIEPILSAELQPESHASADPSGASNSA